MRYHEAEQAAKQQQKKYRTAQMGPDVNRLVVARSDRQKGSTTGVVVDSVAIMDVFIVYDVWCMHHRLRLRAYKTFNFLSCLLQLLEARL